MNSSELLPIHTSGRTWCGIKYIIKSNGSRLNLTGFSGVFIAEGIGKNSGTYRLDLVITDELQGEIEIPKQKINWSEDNYKFETILNFLNGDEITISKGIFPIERGLK